MRASSTVEPPFDNLLYNEVLDVTNDFLYPSNSKINEKEPRHNETPLYQTDFDSPWLFVKSKFHCTRLAG